MLKSLTEVFPQATWVKLIGELVWDKVTAKLALLTGAEIPCSDPVIRFSREQKLSDSLTLYYGASGDLLEIQVDESCIQVGNTAIKIGDSDKIKIVARRYSDSCYVLESKNYYFFVQGKEHVMSQVTIYLKEHECKTEQG